jgi:WD40 repeat protein
MTGHQGMAASVAFSPDGHRIASAGADGTVQLWDTNTRQQIGTPMTGHQGPVYSVAFAPDGRRITSAGHDRTVRLWDTDTGQQIGAPMTGHTDAVRSVAFSPDGQWIVSGGIDDEIWQWATTPADWTANLCDKLNLNMSHRQWHEWTSPDLDYVEVCPGLSIPPDDPAGK